MNILLVNDDGIKGNGLTALAKALSALHNVTVVAPDSERSGYSHAMTMLTKLYVKRVKLPGLSDVPAFCISGTPADCTKIGILKLCETRPDMVIAGINDGANLGSDVCYSGTCAAAMEGSLYKIPSIAISQVFAPENRGSGDFSYAADFTANFIDIIGRAGLESDIMLNVNIPDRSAFPEIRGIKVTEQALLDYGEYYEKEEDKDDSTSTYMLKGSLHPSDRAETDAWAVQNGFISISPMRFSKTDWEGMAVLKHLEG